MPKLELSRPSGREDPLVAAAECRPYRAIVISLTQQELMRPYAGGVMGVVLVALQPVMLVLTYWFVLTIALRIRVSGRPPFLLVFIADLIP